jgi:hypothetical protein
MVPVSGTRDAFEFGTLLFKIHAGYHFKRASCGRLIGIQPGLFLRPGYAHFTQMYKFVYTSLERRGEGKL